MFFLTDVVPAPEEPVIAMIGCLIDIVGTSSKFGSYRRRSPRLANSGASCSARLSL